MRAMDSRRDFTSKKVFSGYFSELGEKANSALEGRPQAAETAAPGIISQEIPGSLQQVKTCSKKDSKPKI